MIPDVVCPRDRARLERRDGSLVCADGHQYPLVDGVPVLVVGTDLDATQPGYWATAEQIAAVRASERPALAGAPVDPYVAELIVGTHGNLYRHVVEPLPRYPIPELPLPPGGGQTLLDVGCNWGRWTVAAARAGYRAVGVDPAFEAIVAARRVAEQLGADARYVVADARRLPFPDRTFDVVFSFGVLQHFSKADAAGAVDEIARTLKPGGTSLVQMANAFGPRNLTQMARRGFREGERFELRYWRPADLVNAFSTIGPTTLESASFFTLNAQTSDLDLLPRRYRLVVRASEALRRVPALTTVADAVYVRSTRID